MQASYKQKLFLYYLAIFSIFTLGVVLFEQSREKEHKTEALEEKLDVYADLADKMIRQYPDESPVPANLISLLPENIRLTLISRQGTVLYDNTIRNPDLMENHALRTEIINAGKKGKGHDIRVSSSNEKEYLYYAKRFNHYYIRLALPYDIQTRHFLKPDNLFLYYIMALFLVMLILINWVAGRFGKSIKRLRNFISAIEQGTLHSHKIKFPDDELGEIGTKMDDNYRRLRESQREIALEREKLLQHVYSSEEGLCFFSADRSVEFYNGLFIKYLNVIVNEANGLPGAALTDIAFEKIARFISDREHQENYFETQINRQGKNFAVRVNVFDDRSFEIIINDVTRQEKMRRLKQEMTGNITHELRTPVTGIRGCLETILEHRLDPEKKQYFIENAYSQVLSLSELIQDMSLITKMEEAPHSFKLEAVSIGDLLENLKRDLEVPLQEKNISLEWNPDRVTVMGNRNLLYSIFRNLTDNVIRYAGNNVHIRINKYNEDRDFYYFSYSDNGVGISGEQHLNRLFERFYRINEGRTRDTGGSGLGLSIVKNAVAFHKGSIVAKNRMGGGLEFLFQLRKG
jgi:signal transduction histidine kinase